MSVIAKICEHALAPKGLISSNLEHHYDARKHYVIKLIFHTPPLTLKMVNLLEEYEKKTE